MSEWTVVAKNGKQKASSPKSIKKDEKVAKSLTPIEPSTENYDVEEETSSSEVSSDEEEFFDAPPIVKVKNTKKNKNIALDNTSKFKSPTSNSTKSTNRSRRRALNQYDEDDDALIQELTEESESCCCCTSLGSCIQEFFTCGGDCVCFDCCKTCGRDVDDCCSLCKYTTKRVLWVTTCACCIVPTFKTLRKHWWILVVCFGIVCTIVGMEMKRQDISTTVFKMNNGLEIPVLGLGTWQSGRRTRRAVRAALDEGYRHIDAASVYGNELEIGYALKDEFTIGTLDRSDIFLTSKLWNSDHHPSKVEAACRQSLKRLGVKYLDLYLMHWPMAYQSNEGLKDQAKKNQKDNTDTSIDTSIESNHLEKEENEKNKNLMFPFNIKTGRMKYDDVHFVDTWEAMENLVTKGLVKSIGLSNFNQTQIDDILNVASIPPQVLQIENHPYLPQHELVNYAKDKGMVVTAYSPLGSPGRPTSWDEGRYDVRPPDLLKHKGLDILEDKYGKTKAQLLLRYQYQRGNSIVVKSTNPTRIASNADIFTWSIETYDMERLSKLEANWWRYCVPMLELSIDEQNVEKISTYKVNTKVKKPRWIVRDEKNSYFPFANEMKKRRNNAKEKSIKYEQAEKREKRKQLKREKEMGGRQPEQKQQKEQDNSWGGKRAKSKVDTIAEELLKFTSKPKPRKREEFDDL